MLTHCFNAEFMELAEKQRVAVTKTLTKFLSIKSASFEEVSNQKKKHPIWSQRSWTLHSYASMHARHNTAHVLASVLLKAQRVVESLDGCSQWYPGMPLYCKQQGCRVQHRT